MPRYKSSDDRTPDQLIEEVMERILERAQRIDAAWKEGPDGWQIVRGNTVRVFVGFDLPDNAKPLIEKACKKSVKLANFKEVIIHRKRWVTILFPPLRYKI